MQRLCSDTASYLDDWELLVAGYGGTEAFMAPEIIRYNGEQEYTELVDRYHHHQAVQLEVLQTVFSKVLATPLAC